MISLIIQRSYAIFIKIELGRYQIPKVGIVRSMERFTRAWEREELFEKKRLYLIPFFSKTLLVFMLIYKNSPIANATYITSERVSVILLMLWAVIKNNMKLEKKTDIGSVRILRKEIRFQFILLFYTVIIFCFVGRSDGETLLEQILNFLFIVPIAVYALEVIIDSVDELMEIILVITLFQSIVILLGMLVPTIGFVIDELPTNRTYVYWTYSYYRSMGYPGGIACVAAYGSIKMALGCVAVYYFLMTKKNALKYWFYFVLIAIAMTAVARTGFVLSIIVFFFILKDKLKHKNFIYGLIVFFCFALVGVLSIFFIMDINTVERQLTKDFSRLFDFFENGFYNSFFKYYLYGGGTVIPSLSIKTIIGTGVISGMSGNGVYVNVDGGFLRMYVALGLPLAIVFYLFQLKIMLKCMKLLPSKTLRNVSIILILMMFLGEFKEFYFYTRYLIVIFFVFTYLGEKGINEKKSKL